MSFEDIIEKIKERPQIWQRTHPHYKNKILRMKLWKQISKELNANENQLKKSWKYLSDQYRREYKKLKANKTMYKGKPVPSGWGYYESLSFLMPEMEIRRDRPLVVVPPSSDSDTANDSAMVQDSYATTHESFQETIDTSSNFENAMYNTTATQARQAQPSRSSEVTKADLILQRLHNLNAEMARVQSEVVKQDEDYMFFMSILPMVRNLPPVRKLQLRGKINEWLLRALSETDPLKNASQHIEESESDEESKEAVRAMIDHSY